MAEQKPEQPLTIEEWRKQTATLARNVAANIDGVMIMGKNSDPQYTLTKLKDSLNLLDTLGIKPADEKFAQQIGILREQGAGGVNTDAIRGVADFLSPPETKTG